ncbi:ribonuclease HI [Paenibacillus sp. 1182]|uniref:reverse transcriptase-like protein n=1 Tax=Paenibacillus sp. 1182 TaxID=2806565 RepID=UPI001AEA4F10|nr:reverse transcriptase-like protein [Paenibacillus sp. 1182]MBP1309129.1 ribonuclease HI [Paenibacillus sp. 1182]
MTTFKVYTDASSRYKAIVEDVGSERGLRKVYPSSIGAVIKDGEQVVGAISERIGFSDSNYAEFLAMYTACRYLIDHNISKVDFYADCLNLVMMVNQQIISGIPELRKLSYAILDCLNQIENYTITWIPRNSNKEAHHMASQAFKVS